MECSTYIKVSRIFKIQVIEVILLIELAYLIYDLHNDFFNKKKQKVCVIVYSMTYGKYVSCILKNI